MDFIFLKTQAFRHVRCIAKVLLLGSLASKAHLGMGQGRGSNYFLELTPAVGTNLPYDLWGTPGTFSVLGARAFAPIAAPNGIEAGFLYQYAGVDKAYTVDLSYRFEIPTEAFLSYFNIGYHYSIFDLEIDYDENGACVPANCLTDSGDHHGFSFGAGVMAPLGTATIGKLGMRFYKNPITWLLLEAGLGIRF